MPVNDRYPLAEVLDACRAWRAARRKRVYIEYLMLAGVNDGPEHARLLAEVLAPRAAFKVNLIPYNPTDGGFDGSSPETIDAFRALLVERGVPATVRLTRGRDIAAACGQLAATSGAPPSPNRARAGPRRRGRGPAGTRKEMSPRPHRSTGQSEVSTDSTPWSLSTWRKARAVSRSSKSRTMSQSS